MNIQISEDENNKFCLHSLPNRNDKHLTNFSFEKNISCLDTKFQKREGKLWTYTNSNNAKALLNYIIISKKWINSTLNYQAYSSFKGVSSDLRIVSTKIRQSIHRNMKQSKSHLKIGPHLSMEI